MRCFVTGASGHLGSHLVRHLAQQGAEVHALVRPTSDLWRIEDVLPRISLISGDMADVTSFSGALKETQIDTVYHLAWHGITADLRNSNEQVNQNVFGSLRLVELAKQLGCKSWIGIGSQAEYGHYPGALTEADATCPTSLYGTAKLCVGMLTQKLCENAGIRHLWFRLFSTYGPHDDSRHLIPTLIDSLLAGKRPALTKSQQRWDYLFIADAVEAISKAADSNIDGVYNLGSGSAYTIESIALQIRDLIDSKLPLGFGGMEYGPNQIMHLQADVSKLEHAIQWSPRTNIADGLRMTVDSHKKSIRMSGAK